MHGFESGGAWSPPPARRTAAEGTVADPPPGRKVLLALPAGALAAVAAPVGGNRAAAPAPPEADRVADGAGGRVLDRIREISPAERKRPGPGKAIMVGPKHAFLMCR
ncbi:hypothetical protein GCM10022221_45220 [Actinocorallia aurea]